MKNCGHSLPIFLFQLIGKEEDIVTEVFEQASNLNRGFIINKKIRIILYIHTTNAFFKYPLSSTLMCLAFKPSLKSRLYKDGHPTY